MKKLKATGKKRKGVRLVCASDALVHGEPVRAGQTIEVPVREVGNLLASRRFHRPGAPPPKPKPRSYFSAGQQEFLMDRRTIYQLFKTLRERAQSGDYLAWQTLRSYQYSSMEALDAIPKEVTKEFERKQKLDHQSFDRLAGSLQEAIRTIKDKRRRNQDLVSARESLSFAKMHLEDKSYHTAEDRELYQVHLIARWEDGSTLLPDLQKDTAKDWATVAVDFWEADCGGNWSESDLWELLGEDVSRRAALESRRPNSEFRSRLTGKFRRFLQDDPERFG